MLNSRKFCGDVLHSFLTSYRAGGGGNKQNRHTKISEKNQKLNEQRVRRMHEDEKAKLVKKVLAIDNSGVHPSRRTRVSDIS